MHTPTPWLIRDDKETLTGPDGSPVVTTSFPARSTEECEGNAALVAVAVNNHHSLVDALNEWLHLYEGRSAEQLARRVDPATMRRIEASRAALAAVERG